MRFWGAGLTSAIYYTMFRQSREVRCLNPNSRRHEAIKFLKDKEILFAVEIVRIESEEKGITGELETNLRR